MKKMLALTLSISLLVVSLLVLVSVSCERKDKNDSCIGHWGCDETTIETIIWKDKDGNYTVSEFDNASGIKMKTVYFNTNEKGNLELKSTYEPNNYTSVVEFLPQNDTIMLGIVTGEYSEVLKLKRLK